jgi:hypothetical protein
MYEITAAELQRRGIVVRDDAMTLKPSLRASWVHLPE